MAAGVCDGSDALVGFSCVRVDGRDKPAHDGRGWGDRYRPFLNGPVMARLDPAIPTKSNDFVANAAGSMRTAASIGGGGHNGTATAALPYFVRLVQIFE